MPDPVNAEMQPVPRRLSRTFFLAALLMVSGGALPGCGKEPGERSARAAGTSARPAPARVDFSAPQYRRFGDGFLVWESARGGSWRIWTRRLDGSGLAQLSPEEAGREHCCAHISPDGRHVAYLSRPAGGKYGDNRVLGALHLVGVHGVNGKGGRGDRVIAPAARTYGFGNRSALWHGPGALVFVDGEGATVRLDLTSGRGERLATRQSDRLSWLVDRTLTHATSGMPTFSLYDRARRAVLERAVYGGCEPYFSDDGRWGVWVAGAGGPIYRIDLATRTVSTMVEKNDPRLPPERNYLYFPMLSRDGRLLAFSASQRDHDHERGDYDVFLAEVDPGSLEVLGRPLRFTDDPGSDRYPDAYLAPLALGRALGEAPFAVDFPSPGPGTWEWSFGDGIRRDRRESREPPERAEGPVKHLFAAPGTFAVEARQGDRILRGRVTAEPARPPRVTGVAVRRGREVVVSFDERVDLAKLTASLASGAAIARREPGPDGRTLTLVLAGDLAGPDRLRLAGVADRAGRPNRMAPVELPVSVPRWPSDRKGLIFLWERADQPNLVPEPGTGAERAYAVTSRGRARLDHDQAMVLGGEGTSWVAAEEAWDPIAAAARRANEIAVELTLTPAASPPGPPGGRAGARAAIVSLARRKGSPNFTLGEEGGRLFATLLTGPEPQARVDLGPVPAGRPTHLVVAYSPGRLVAYVNGRKAVETDAVQGDFYRWKEGPVLFGDVWGGGGAWAGELEGIAIYDRLLGAEEAAENARLYLAGVAARRPVPRVTLGGRLAARSKIPTLEEIAPYRQALVVYEYAVERAPAGGLPGRPSRVRVAHWAILDGKTQPVARAREGDEARLVLEPFADNPQLESIYISDSLEADPALPLYLDVRR